ncbi:MAG: hypothetical protein ABEJ95_05325 [Candidatus Nanohalobium sp.]
MTDDETYEFRVTENEKPETVLAPTGPKAYEAEFFDLDEDRTVVAREVYHQKSDTVSTLVAGYADPEDVYERGQQRFVEAEKVLEEDEEEVEEFMRNLGRTEPINVITN